MTFYAVVMEWLHSPSSLETDHEAALELMECLQDAGYTIVPTAPTEAMQLAGHNVRSDQTAGMPTGCGIDEIWNAMVAASKESV